jgi:hypothetical protein
MASFDEHLEKAKLNLTFLERVCRNESSFWDWKVTISFYAGVHLINAHIANKTGLHYRSHEQVIAAINPNEIMSVCKLEENKYLAYAKLRNLSRRSRYLVSDKEDNKDTKAFYTYDKHFAKAIKHLDILISYINKEYKQNIQNIEVSCIELKQNELINFSVVAMLA